MALQYNDGYQEYVFSFANNINTREGGSHLTGFRAALTRTIGAYAQATGYLKTFKGALTGVGLDPAPAPQVVNVPTPVPVQSKACAEVPSLLDGLRADLKKAKKQHDAIKVAKVKGQIAGVKSLAKLC